MPTCKQLTSGLHLHGTRKCEARRDECLAASPNCLQKRATFSGIPFSRTIDSKLVVACWCYMFGWLLDDCCWLLVDVCGWLIVVGWWWLMVASYSAFVNHWAFVISAWWSLVYCWLLLVGWRRLKWSKLNVLARVAWFELLTPTTISYNHWQWISGIRVIPRIPRIPHIHCHWLSGMCVNRHFLSFP